MLASDPISACENAFADYLRAQVPGLTVYLEWPAPNQQLTYPSVTLFSGKDSFMNLMPETIATTLPDQLNKTLVTQIIGEHDWKMQLDLWCASKFERETTLGAIKAAINAQVSDGSGQNKASGLSLQLTNYYNDWARFDIDSIERVDDEASAQRRERRVKISLLVNCREIAQQTLYAMTQIQVQMGVGQADDQTAQLENFHV